MSRPLKLLNATPRKSPKMEGGILLTEFTDVEKLQSAVNQLYMLLDDIDTIGDLAKNNDAFYRRLVEAKQRHKNLFITTDGYDIFFKK